MKKAIILDLDGTLVNSLPDISAAMNRSLEKHGLPPFPEDSYRYMVGKGVFHLTRCAVNGQDDRFDEVLKDYMADYSENCLVNSYAYSGMREALLTLPEKGFSLCVFSNKDQADAEQVVHFCYPDIQFACIRGRNDGVPVKPDPAGALLIVSGLGIRANECWYVGDTSTDMQCGNAAGMETIGVLWGFRTESELLESGACHIAKCPADLVRIALPE